MTSTTEPMGRAVGWSWQPAGFRMRTVVPLSLVVFAALLIAAAGYEIGAHRSNTQVAVGYAYASPVQISASSHGWSYDIPLNVSWRDAAGAWHQGTRPACLAASDRRLPVKFAWVPIQVNDVTWRTVVSVDCG